MEQRVRGNGDFLEVDVPMPAVVESARPFVRREGAPTGRGSAGQLTTRGHHPGQAGGFGYRTNTSKSNSSIGREQGVGPVVPPKRTIGKVLHGSAKAVTVVVPRCAATNCDVKPWPFCRVLIDGKTWRLLVRGGPIQG